MSTYAEMQQRIADEIDDSDLLDGGQIAKAIQTAIKFYERKRLYFNTSRSLTFATVADQEYYGATDLAQIPGLISIDSMYVTVNGSRYPIAIIDNATIDAAQSGSAQGSPPRNYSIVAQQIRLYGIPTDAWTVTLSDALYRLDALADDDDENAWTTDAEELIRQAARRIIASDVTKELPMGSGPTPAEQMALAALQQETRLRRGPIERRADELVAMQSTGGRYDITTDRAG